MRKLFFFRSSASSSGNSNPVPPPPNNEKLYWENPWESGAKNQENDKVRDSSQSPKDLVFVPEKQCPERQGFVSGLRRSRSFSSSAFFSDPSGSPSTSSNAPHQSADYPICLHSLTPERCRKPKRGDRTAIRKPHGVEKLDSPISSRGYVDSSGNSPCSSPVPLKCRATRLAQASSKVLDLYIDGEQQEENLRPKSDSQRISPSTGNDGCFMENRKLPNSRRPPRVQNTAPSSPTYKKECLRSSSFKDVRNANPGHSTRDWTGDDVRPATPQKLAKNVVERLSQVFPRGLKMKSQDLDCETTTTVEDIFEDYSEPQPSLSSNGTVQKGFLSERMSLYDAPCEISNDYGLKEIPGFQTHGYFHGDDPVGIKHESSLYSRRKEEDLDAELRRKGREAEERAMLLSEELEQVKLQNSSFSVSALLQTIRNITDDRRNLAVEVSSQIQSRIAERSSASEALKLAKIELDSRTTRLEREKNELQMSLEKELDRRSSDWSFKLKKYQSEEQRLRERVRELAEQNVSLQREVSSFNSREVEARSRIMQSELQLNDLRERMGEAKGDNHTLQQAISKLQEHTKGLEADLDCIKSNYKEKENENKELHKAIARLLRICGEQEKTISGLRQGLSEEIGKQSLEKGDLVVKLQMEHVRLTGVEQVLRREMESYRLEVDSLRHENINLLSRLQGSGNGVRFSSFKLDHELRARVECLQNQCFSLVDEISQLSGNLIDFVKTCHIPEIPGSELGKEIISNGFDGYSIVEYDMKFQSFKRGFHNLRQSLQMTFDILQEKSELDASESQSESTDGGMSGHPKVRPLKESDAEFDLKAEILLTKVLREKLYFKEVELEQLQAELATSVRGHDILRFEIQRSQDSVSCLTHKVKDLELQMMRKDEKINQLQNDLQECMKELTITRGILPKVSDERDLMWEEVKQYSEKNMLLNCEVNSLKKKIESLDEDILIKEGQITILKDSIDKKPFEILYSPRAMKEFTLD
ncbi:uncharacterized protein LOC143877677 [Tasmannia lanceolata]|uniref:uncharacterized protein LOC143877677 n=1 Tax=Tasmannia lanceolata TaxID=3420 RepID=UPI0040647AB2